MTYCIKDLHLDHSNDYHWQDHHRPHYKTPFTTRLPLFISAVILISFGDLIQLSAQGSWCGGDETRKASFLIYSYGIHQSWASSPSCTSHFLLIRYLNSMKGIIMLGDPTSSTGTGKRIRMSRLRQVWSHFSISPTKKKLVGFQFEWKCRCIWWCLILYDKIGNYDFIVKRSRNRVQTNRRTRSVSYSVDFWGEKRGLFKYGKKKESFRDKTIKPFDV